MSNRKALLARIHIAKKELALSDDEYRDILAIGTGHTSAKDLTDAELQGVINHFREMGWGDTPPGKEPALSRSKGGRGKSGAPPCKGGRGDSEMKKRFESLAGRPGMATPKQLRMLEAVWMENPHVRKKTATGLQHFIDVTFEISGLRFIKRDQVGKIKTAIEKIR